MIDELLEQAGLKYEDLNTAERETLNVWMSALGKNEVNITTIRDYIISMKSAVEQELSVTGLDEKKDTLLKARLRNYLLLEAFLISPEKVKQQIKNSIMGMVPKYGTKVNGI